MFKNYFILSFLFLFILISCSQKSENEIKDIAAYVDSFPIYFSSIDNSVKQELYDELSRIYLIRKIALQEKINDRLLYMEALKKGITTDLLLDSLYNANLNEDKIQKYIINNELNDGIPVLERTLIRYNQFSPEGKEVLIKRYKEYLLRTFLDTLRKSHNIEVFFQPPKAPKVDLDLFSVHYKSYNKSNVNFIIVSDFECDECKQAKAIIDTIYEKYKQNVNFGFLNYGSYVSISALASESASRQNKFWEMHDSIFKLKTLPDTSDILRLANNLRLNIDKFYGDFKSEELKDNLFQQYLQIKNNGIYATPTIIIGGKLVYNSFSIEEIEQLLHESIYSVGNYN